MGMRMPLATVREVSTISSSREVDFGILVKGFVEITQPEEDDRIGVLAFDFEILLADGGDVIRHALILKSGHLFGKGLRRLNARFTYNQSRRKFDTKGWHERTID